MTYKPPHRGTFDFFFASPQKAREMARDNQNYRAGYMRSKGSKDARRR